MALVEDGMGCPLCNEPIDDVTTCFSTTMVGLPHPLSILDDAAAHPECTVAWPHRDDFASAYNAGYGTVVVGVDSAGRLRWLSETATPAFLPSDLYGRLACLLIGLFFAIPGVSIALLLFTKPMKILEVPVLFEGVALASLFGCSLIIWAICVPSWLTRCAEGIAGHMMHFLFLLLIPFAIEAMMAIWIGGV